MTALIWKTKYIMNSNPRPVTLSARENENILPILLPAAWCAYGDTSVRRSVQCSLTTLETTDSTPCHHT